jgi:hypothetical protein
MIVILAKATGAGNSADFIVRPGVPVSIAAYPEANLGADTGALVLKNPDGTYDAVYLDGSAVELSATRPQMIVDMLGTFRIEFSARTAAIGVGKAAYERDFG